jgi:adenylylsulfate kinase
VLVDGDEIRKIFKHDEAQQAYTIVERRKNADRICELCAWLDRQNINVVCCILSIFGESQDWNRRNYSKYFEVYIDVPMDVLVRREVKGLYRSAIAGETKHVVGIDIPFNPPKNPDYILDNTEDGANMQKVAIDIIGKIRAKYGSI